MAIEMEVYYCNIRCRNEKKPVQHQVLWSQVRKYNRRLPKNEAISCFWIWPGNLEEGMSHKGIKSSFLVERKMLHNLHNTKNLITS
jgi:hypothetical protein